MIITDGNGWNSCELVTLIYRGKLRDKWNPTRNDQSFAPNHEILNFWDRCLICSCFCFRSSTANMFVASLIAFFAVFLAQIARSCPPHDSSLFICCDGVLKHKRSFNACCGTQPYDRSTCTCCDGRVLVKEPNYECCGNILYNNEFYMCCNGKVYSTFFGRSC